MFAGSLCRSRVLEERIQSAQLTSNARERKRRKEGGRERERNMSNTHPRCALRYARIENALIRRQREIKPFTLNANEANFSSIQRVLKQYLPLTRPTCLLLHFFYSTKEVTKEMTRRDGPDSSSTFVAPSGSQGTWSSTHPSSRTLSPTIQSPPPPPLLHHYSDSHPGSP